MMATAVGLCACGCGGPTRISLVTDPSRGWVRGQPRRFILGHSLTRRSVAPGRYRKASSGDREHRAVVERAMGRPLPAAAEVHHFNEDKQDNRPSNLVVCEDKTYHRLLHYRQRAKAACGNASWQRCEQCGKWDAAERIEERGTSKDGKTRVRRFHIGSCPKRKHSALREQGAGPADAATSAAPE